jgi:hypothetical protein
MSAGAYALALPMYEALMFLSFTIGMLGILLNQRGSRRVGLCIIACQLVLMAASTIAPWPDYRIAGTAIINGLFAIPVIMRPPAPAPLQRLACGLFLSSAAVNGVFALFEQTPFIKAWQWFSTAAIDFVMIGSLGGMCGGLVGKAVADWLRDRPHRSPSSRGYQ